MLARFQKNVGFVGKESSERINVFFLLFCLDGKCGCFWLSLFLKKSRGKRTDGVEKVTLASPSRFSPEWGERECEREREKEERRGKGGERE